MKICVVGTGYVGLPSGVGFAQLGHDVVCVDKDENKINKLNNGCLILYEDGLEDKFKASVKSGRLTFTTSMKNAVEDADVVLLAVGTPPNHLTGEADLQYIYAAADELSQYLNNYTVIAVKSTVPVGTGDEVEKIISAKTNFEFDVISLPEFLREGYALHDFFNPDRIIIGSNSERARKVIDDLYSYFADKTQIIHVSRRSSETIKYASNAFLAMKIHYINEMSDFCEVSGADIKEVAKGMGLDKRIGSGFLNAGPGFGGSCFPKDTSAMLKMAEKFGVNMSLIETTINGNYKRKKHMAERILNQVKDIQNPKIAVWGLAFKNGTDDCRESPAIEILCELIKQKNIKITVYDPKASDNAKKILGDSVEYADDMYETIKEADVLAILTEWMQFSKVDINKMKKLMKHKRVVDLRNMLSPQEMSDNSFIYQCIGKINF